MEAEAALEFSLIDEHSQRDGQGRGGAGAGVTSERQRIPKPDTSNREKPLSERAA